MTSNGRELVDRLFVESALATDKFARRSRTGYVLYLNSASTS
jgi:hypothetical protein